MPRWNNMLDIAPDTNQVNGNKCVCYQNGYTYCHYHKRELTAEKHSPHFEIKAIEHKHQRYPTAGDFWGNPDEWKVRVSKMSDPRHEWLVLLHEFVEMILMLHRGIPEELQGEFDRMFERERAEGKWTNEEPGFDPRSPYLKEHTFATRIERMIAKELGVDWKAFGKEVDSL